MRLALCQVSARPCSLQIIYHISAGLESHQQPRAFPNSLCANTARASRSVNPSIDAASSRIACQPAQPLPAPLVTQPLMSVTSASVPINLIARFMGFNLVFQGFDLGGSFSGFSATKPN
jgi:hypothetical protein